MSKHSTSVDAHRKAAAEQSSFSVTCVRGGHSKFPQIIKYLGILTETQRYFQLLQEVDLQEEGSRIKSDQYVAGL